jgi:hypothetical protein
MLEQNRIVLATLISPSFCLRVSVDGFCIEALKPQKNIAAANPPNAAVQLANL